jgi:UDP-glucose 4-epimerase
MNKVLITGGCGYIGSNLIIKLVNNNFQPISIDNFSNSSKYTFKQTKHCLNQDIVNKNINICNFKKLYKFFQKNEIDSIIHCAALTSVPKSIQEPINYYENNIVGLINLLKCVSLFNIKKFIFISSCSVYGTPLKIKVNETTPLLYSSSPYSSTKQMAEKIIDDYRKSNKDKNICILRLFNPFGSIIKPTPNNRLFSIIDKKINSKKKIINIYGKDLNTKDGTCIRDYIHISDVTNFIITVLEEMDNHQEYYEVFNVGTGKGTTILEVLDSFKIVYKTKLDISWKGKRDGDIEAIYADITKAKQLLKWEPKYNIIQGLKKGVYI